MGKKKQRKSLKVDRKKLRAIMIESKLLKLENQKNKINQDSNPKDMYNRNLRKTKKIQKSKETKWKLEEPEKK